MKKLFAGLLISIGVAVTILGSVFGINKAIDTYKYYARLDALEFYVHQTYGMDCCIDYDNLVINDNTFMFNVIDSEGNHIQAELGYFK